MVVLATPARAATASTVRAPTSPSRASNCRVASRIACRERCTRRSDLGVGAGVSRHISIPLRNVVVHNAGRGTVILTKRYGAFGRGGDTVSPQRLVNHESEEE